MNCLLCQKELEAYLDGKVPEGIRAKVEAHLAECSACATTFEIMAVSEKVMKEEKNEQSNPFLSTRIMAEIETLEQRQTSKQGITVRSKVLKPVFISISIAAALFIGIIAGNLSKPTQSSFNEPVELSYINDAALESVGMLSNE